MTAKTTVPLAKSYDPKKMEFPAFASLKIDGSAVRFDVVKFSNGDLYVDLKSRQDKPVVACETVVDEWVRKNQGKFVRGFKYTFVGELYDTGNLLGTASTQTHSKKRKEDQGTLVSIALYDYVCENLQSGGVPALKSSWVVRKEMLGFFATTSNVTVLPQTPVANDQEVQEFKARLAAKYNNRHEGIVIRSAADEWRLEGRSWGYGRIVNEPTLDVRIVGFTQGMDKDGLHKQTLGSLITQDTTTGEFIGVGPGKMKHADRDALWEKVLAAHAKDEFKFIKVQVSGKWTWVYFMKLEVDIAEVKHKPDPNYTLRQPTFQRWREDKTESDI